VETHVKATERHLPFGIACYPTQVNAPRLNQHVNTRSTYPGGMGGWVDLSGWLYTNMVYPFADSDTSKLYSLDSDPTGSWAHDLSPVS